MPTSFTNGAPIARPLKIWVLELANPPATARAGTCLPLSARRLAYR